MAFHKARALQEAEKSVAQGKTAQAIRQYQDILDNDPSDVSLLNTVGDLYIRDKNITEGLRQFHKLAEAYVREGFNVKAIAIYRKISKVDPNSIDTLLKLADLYQLQGLSREAREQYLQAVEFFKKRTQLDRVLEVLQKLVQLDPESITFRTRLATESESAGKKEEAAAAYLESAEISLRRDDQAGAEPNLKKAAELDPKNAKIQILLARLAVARYQPEEAERIITASPELQADPAGKKILLDAYIANRKLPEAAKLVLDVFHANPSDFTPISTVSGLLVEKGEFDGAYKMLASVADSQINQNHAAPLLESLRRIWTKAPSHIPTLELIHMVCEKTADELTLPEVLEALGRAHEQAGDLEKAEGAYQKLTEREPENETFRGYLNAVRQKLGRDIGPADFSSAQMAMAVEEEALTPEPEVIDADQEMMVKEALENSDLFSRYNLTEKAIAELEKVLQIYPDQIEVHRRILEISRKGFPARGAAAAAQLSRIYNERGDTEMANKYHAIATAKGAMPDLPLPASPVSKKVEVPAPPPPPPPAPVQAAPSAPVAEAVNEFPINAVVPQDPAAAPVAPPPAEFSFEPPPPAAPAIEPPAAPPAPLVLNEQTMELDLSGDLEAMAAFGFDSPAAAEPEAVAPPPVEEPVPAEAPPPVEVPAPVEEFALPPIEEESAPPVEAALPEPPAEPQPEFEQEAIPVDLEDSRIEVEFYLENGFVDEARQTVAKLEEKYPGSPYVEELRQKLDAHISQAPPPETLEAFTPPDGPPETETEFHLEEQAPAPEPPQEVAAADLPVPEQAAETSIGEDWALPSDYAESAQIELVEDTVAPPAVTEPEPEIANIVPAPEPAPEPEPEPVAVAATPPVEEIPAAAPPAEVAPEVPTPVAEVAPPAPAPPEPVKEPVVEVQAAAASGSSDLFGDLAGDLASSLDGLAAAAPPAPAAPSAPAVEAATPTARPFQGASQLSGLLADMEDSAAANRDDPETHYNLGVAFREMGLLDESIGEFQKVVRGAGKGKYPPNFLQACSLLAICFMEKKMPALAVKWYKRALETPDLDEEALMALEYDLGVAYEQAGDSRSALERFTEVYSQNIDFRDVAEKIRELQQKA